MRSGTDGSGRGGGGDGGVMVGMGVEGGRGRVIGSETERGLWRNGSLPDGVKGFYEADLGCI